MDGRDYQQDQDSVLEAQVRTDRLQQLFRQSVFATLGSFLAALMLCSLCWDRFEHNVAAGWIALLSASTSLRVWMFFTYYRAPESERTPARWERQYWITLMLSATIWGGGALALMPRDDVLAQALVMLFTVGMSVAAVSCYCAYRSMTLVSIGLVLLPGALWLLLQPSAMQIGIAVATLGFSSFIVSATGELSGALEKAFRLTREMERAHRLSSHAAQTDELTGLKNRRAFFEQAQQLYSDCARRRAPLCVLMLDMDHFKRINDTYGHQVGDHVLREIGTVISAAFRACDVHGRLGGEEFAAVLPDTPLDVALQIAAQLVQMIGTLDSATAHGVTASLGIASIHTADKDLSALMNRADKALYQAKAQGRNQVVVAP